MTLNYGFGLTGLAYIILFTVLLYTSYSAYKCKETMQCISKRNKIKLVSKWCLGLHIVILFLFLIYLFLYIPANYHIDTSGMSPHMQEYSKEIFFQSVYFLMALIGYLIIITPSKPRPSISFFALIFSSIGLFFGSFFIFYPLKYGHVLFSNKLK